jgi:hypothetical protein
MNPLEEHRWQRRLILYTASPADAELLTSAIQRHWPELEERAVLLVRVGEGPNDHRHVVLNETEVEALRLAYSMDSQRTELLLIGKDGGLKERIQRVDLPFLIQAIDRMPMRQSEVRQEQR